MLCNHAAGLCEAFMGFNKSLIVIASTRFEIGRHDPARWKLWNQVRVTQTQSESSNTLSELNERSKRHAAMVSTHPALIFIP